MASVRSAGVSQLWETSVAKAQLPYTAGTTLLVGCKPQSPRKPACPNWLTFSTLCMLASLLPESSIDQASVLPVLVAYCIHCSKGTCATCL